MVSGSGGLASDHDARRDVPKLDLAVALVDFLAAGASTAVKELFLQLQLHVLRELWSWRHFVLFYQFCDRSGEQPRAGAPDGGTPARYHGGRGSDGC